MRLFVAVNPGQPLRDSVAACVDDLRDRWPLKWVRPESLHITLKFLGEQPEQRLPELLETLSAALRPLEGFSVAPTGAGVFPSHGQARVLFLHLDRDERLAALARAVGRALSGRFEDIGETAGFRAHLTLGRVRRGGLQEGEEALRNLQTPHFPAFRVDHVELVESRLTSTGPLYATRGVFPLAATAQR